jgi:glycosyltransferase involved in cell wall biosynthesis
VITDSPIIQRYYSEHYKCSSHSVAYGADVDYVSPGKWLEKYDLIPQEYVLYVGRLEPENNVHILVQAFQQVRTRKKLVVVGDVPYPTPYSKKLKEQSNSKIIFTGFIYGDGYRELCSNAYVYIQPTEVGGVHPALIEAMGFGNCVLVNNIPANLDAIGDAGLSYDRKLGAEDLSRQLQRLLDNPQLVETYRRGAREYVKKRYSWDEVTKEYEDLCLRLVGKEYKATEACE